MSLIAAALAAITALIALEDGGPASLLRHAYLVPVLAAALRFGGVGGGRPDAGTAGARVTAEIMNVADAGVGERVFAHLDEHAPELGESIRRLMLTFEDLVRLDSRGMQLVLKEVQREDLMLALRTASPAMREKVFANLSQRAAEILNDDIASMGPVPLKEVENAQLVIVATVRRLESEQRLTLAGSGDDVVV